MNLFFFFTYLFFFIFILGQPDTCQRWDKTSKTYKTVSRPQIVGDYNGTMGGVDKLDMLVSIYRTFIRSKKWTIRMLTHGLDLAATNAWFEYKKDCNALNIPKQRMIDLIHFRHQISESLIRANQPMTKHRGRPSAAPSPTRLSTPTIDSSTRSISSTTPSPVSSRTREIRVAEDVWFDQVSHWPGIGATQRCKQTNCKERTVFYCKKCEVHLCITRNRNCFYNYHNTN